MTRATLDAEASGYFLVSEKQAQGGSWRRVAAAEAERVWGAGDAPVNDKAPPTCRGLCGYAINEEKVGLTLGDTPVGYSPPIGPPAEVSLVYDMYDVSQPGNFNYFNVSQKWTINWLSFVEDDPTAPGTNVNRYDRDDGFLYAELGYDASTHAFTPEEDDGSVLILGKTSPITYQRSLRDGTVETYAQSDGSAVFPRNVFLTRITDPQGNTLTLNYRKVNGQARLASLTDATGRKTTFGYGSAFSPLLITKVTDPFGRSAALTYDSNGRLSSITDVIGLTSKFTYDPSSLINSLTTPYGTTRFTYGISNAPSGPGDVRFLNVVDPMGFGEREETFEPIPLCRLPTRRYRTPGYGESVQRLPAVSQQLSLEQVPICRCRLHPQRRLQLS